MWKYEISGITIPQNFTKPTTMPNRHIDANINKAIALTTLVGLSQDRGAPRSFASSVETANRQLDRPPTLQISSNTLQNTVSALIVVLDASRPRRLRLARSVSSRAIFGVASHTKTPIRL